MEIQATFQNCSPLNTEGEPTIVAIDHGGGEDWETREGTTPPKQWGAKGSSQGCTEGMDPNGRSPMDLWGGLHGGDSYHMDLSSRSSSLLGYKGKNDLKIEIQFRDQLISVIGFHDLHIPSYKTNNHNNLTTKYNDKNNHKNNHKNKYNDKKNDKYQNHEKKNDQYDDRQNDKKYDENDLNDCAVCDEWAPLAPGSWQGPGGLLGGGGFGGC